MLRKFIEEIEVAIIALLETAMLLKIEAVDRLEEAKALKAALAED